MTDFNNQVVFVPPKLNEPKLLVLAILKIAVEEGPANTPLLKAYLKRAAELAETIKN